MTIPKCEAVDVPDFDAEFWLLAELAGLELLAEILVVTLTYPVVLETMVFRAIEGLSILFCTGITDFFYQSWYERERWKHINMYATPVQHDCIY